MSNLETKVAANQYFSINKDMSTLQLVETLSLGDAGHRTVLLTRSVDGTTISINYMVELTDPQGGLHRRQGSFILGDVVAAWDANTTFAVNDGYASVKAFTDAGGLAAALPHPELATAMQTTPAVLTLETPATATVLGVLAYGDKLVGLVPA